MSSRYQAAFQILYERRKLYFFKKSIDTTCSQSFVAEELIDGLRAALERGIYLGLNVSSPRGNVEVRLKEFKSGRWIVRLDENLVKKALENDFKDPLLRVNILTVDESLIQIRDDFVSIIVSPKSRKYYEQGREEEKEWLKENECLGGL